MNLTEGTIVAEHYKLLKQLGHGSFGDVWLAHNMLADIDVAIKFYGTLDQKGLDEFRNEFKIAYKLNHPNLLSINHFDVFENCPYLVMPYCANGSASKLIGQLTEHELWRFIHDVASGLAFLHEQQPPIVHQDIKPDNILITEEGRYVISDFGISRSFKTMMSRTNNMNSSGTLAYMGPERFSEKPMMVLASDIWAFGMTTFELMTGDVLWGGMGGCVQLNGARIPTNDGQWSNTLYQLVTACLAPNTWDRPSAAQISQYAAARLQGKEPPLPFLKTQPVLAPAAVPAQPTEIPVVKKPETPVVRKPETPVVQKFETPVVEKTNIPREKSNTYHEDFSLKYFVIFAIACLAALVTIVCIVIFNHSKTTETPPPAAVEVAAPAPEPATVEEAAAVPPAPEQAAPQKVPEPQKAATQKAVIQEKAVTQEKPQVVVKEAKPVIQEEPVPTTQQPVQQVVETQPKETTVKTPTTTQTTTADPADDQAFRACQTPADYNLYLRKYPNGRHRAEAQRALSEFQKQRELINNKLPADKRKQLRSINYR